MRILFSLAAGGVLALSTSPALADCACLCLDGAYRPVCQSAEEVAEHRGLCYVLAQQSCPDAPSGEALPTFAPPVEGVNNCREAQVYDAGAGGFVATRVCDVALDE